MAQGLATQTPISRGTTLFTGGATHHHPFKFVDASTLDPVAAKTKIASISELTETLWPLSTLAITAEGGSGSYQDDITITDACYIYLKCTVEDDAVTAAEITKTDPADGELITFDATTPFAQTAFYVILAQVVSGSQPNEPGYDFSIDGDPYHLTQVAFTNLRLEQRVVSGRVATYAVTA
jgi:hypothetical protein